ncbi:solute carrier family 35 member E1 isoform X2 [Biomphalaria glabrata]|nr:solute carrier family 35 member E1 homolog isoform X2 [Biomphalaria glabrata]XP_013067247.1 solute carrier family 35 member E1 homolog isoform X2 [Biomphalaria glabrata]XP_055885332.1 solute carrier family 35 member E1 homolog isoform X2 [Biomphalaria glabrata]XP_055885333.1 solute carrier family 35 member E1 homolog isoform X2 [Biomphalaria glabrata]XP_055885334.1 solute carrier family 35 member E1 homolog isoform X2 [Biomphalaria glabrata]KAI8754825.1 putative solute carrier family 35 mem
MDGKVYFQCMKLSIICILWYLSSTTDNILGKIIMTELPYPMTVTMTHLVTASIFLGQIKSFLNVPKGKPIDKKYFYIMILPLALGKFISSVSSYVSIWKVSVSYAHTVKATLPLFTVCLARLILGEKQTWPVYFTLIPIIVGVTIATATELSFDKIGLTSSVVATFCFSLQTIFTKKCLKDTGYHHLELLTFITRLSASMFIPVWFLYDFIKIYQDTKFLENGKVGQTIFMLLCAGLCNMMHNVLAFSVLAIVSPLSYAVANATKRIAIIGGSLIILQNPVGPMNILGMLIAILGVLAYNKAKYDQHQAEKIKEVLPFTRSTSELKQLSSGFGLPHSKSDLNFSNGHIEQLSHKSPLLQEYEALNGFQLIPLTDHSAPDVMNVKPSLVRGATVSSTGRPTLHSRAVFHV